MLQHAQPGNRQAIFTLHPLLHFNHTPSLMLNFLADHLLWSLSPLCHYSQGSVQILVVHPAFLLPVEPPRPILLAHSHSLVSVPNTKKHILPGTLSSHTWQDIRNISYQASPSYNSLLRTRNDNRKPMNATPI